MKPEKKTAVVVAMDTAVKVANALKAIDTVKPAPAKVVAVEKVVKPVEVSAPVEKVEPKASKKEETTRQFGFPHGGSFGPNPRIVVAPEPGKPAQFTSDHRNWRARPMPANEAPKVLSKVGNTVTDKEFKLLAGGVAVNGALLEPIAKDMTYLELQTLSTNKHGIHLPEGTYPHSVYSAGNAPGPFDVYQFELNGDNVVIILDKDSSYWFSGDTFYHQNTNHYQFATARHSEEVVTKGDAVVLLENSHLKNCGVIGVVCILNGDFCNFELNNSRYQHTKDIHPRFGFAATIADTPSPVTKHPECRGGSLVNTRVTNSKLASGYYQNCNISDSTLEFGENHYSAIVRASLYNSTIKAKSKVVIIDGSFQDSNFNGSELALSGFTLDHVNLYLEKVFAPSKVCISKFDATDSNYASYHMVRQSFSTINLYRHSATSGNLIIKISDDDESLRTTIKEWVRSGGESGPWHNQDDMPTKNGVIAKSVARYTVDTIMARLASIRLLDEVQSMARSTGSQAGYSLLDHVHY